MSIENLNNWPKNEKGHFICTKEKPMNLKFKNIGYWEHDDIKETDYDGDYSIELKCCSCNHIWRIEMPE